MALDELGVGVTDVVVAEMVECAPASPDPDVVVPDAPDASPTTQSLEATIEQTGAGPPPKGRA